MTREEAIDVLKHNYPSACFEDLCEAVDVAIQALSIHPERKKGKWILVRDADETGNALYECSVCHKGEVHVPIVEVNYCWNCGADMRGEDDGKNI